MPWSHRPALPLAHVVSSGLLSPRVLLQRASAGTGCRDGIRFSGSAAASPGRWPSAGSGMASRRRRFLVGHSPEPVTGAAGTQSNGRLGSHPKPRRAPHAAPNRPNGILIKPKLSVFPFNGDKAGAGAPWGFQSPVPAGHSVGSGTGAAEPRFPLCRQLGPEPGSRVPAVAADVAPEP